MGKKRIAIMQPTYLPWLGYFNLMSQVDVFVYYNHVQFEKQSWQQRNRIRNRGGEIMLTVPVKAKFGQRIDEVLIDNQKGFQDKHLKTILHSYSKSLNFSQLFEEITQVYGRKHERLEDLNIDLIELGRKYFGIKTEILYSKDFDVEGSKVEALIDVCKKLDAKEYVSPPGAREYIEVNNIFLDHGIELTYHQYSHPIYKQVNYPDFISHLSFLDYLFNVQNSTDEV